jgi:hypothetical protein
VYWAVRQDQNLRSGFSQTVNRPEFRELAPFEFTDIVGGRAVVGNPELTRALIRNYDVRWEWFPAPRRSSRRASSSSDFDEPHRAVRRADGAAAHVVHQRRVGAQHRGRARGAQGAWPALLVGGNYTFVDSSSR